MSWVEEVFSQVTTKHPFPEDPSLLQLLLGGPGLHEGAQEGDQFPVLLRYWDRKEDRKRHVGWSEYLFTVGCTQTLTLIHAGEWNPKLVKAALLCVWVSILMLSHSLCVCGLGSRLPGNNKGIFHIQQQHRPRPFNTEHLPENQIARWRNVMSSVFVSGEMWERLSSSSIGEANKKEVHFSRQFQNLPVSHQ